MWLKMRADGAEARGGKARIEGVGCSANWTIIHIVSVFSYESKSTSIDLCCLVYGVCRPVNRNIRPRRFWRGWVVDVLGISGMALALALG
jgi:hypothetical protein